MSLHVHHHDCGHEGPRDARRTFWTSWCDCGWEGELYWSDESADAAGRARIEYVRHIEETMGAEGFYTAPVGCRNCGSHHKQGIVIGTHASSGVCDRCGTRMLQSDNDVWDESREASRRWSL